jgi:hypothetical protein
MPDPKERPRPPDGDPIEPENPSSGPQAPERRRQPDGAGRDPGAGHTREEGYDEA